MNWIEFVKKYKEVHPNENGVAVSNAEISKWCMDNDFVSEMRRLFFDGEAAWWRLHNVVETEADKHGWTVSWLPMCVIFYTKPDMAIVNEMLKEFAHKKVE